MGWEWVLLFGIAIGMLSSAVITKLKTAKTITFSIAFSDDKDKTAAGPTNKHDIGKEFHK